MIHLHAAPRGVRSASVSMMQEQEEQLNADPTRRGGGLSLRFTVA
jgi:hypothetical protein